MLINNELGGTWLPWDAFAIKLWPIFTDGYLETVSPLFFFFFQSEGMHQEQKTVLRRDTPWISL